MKKIVISLLCFAFFPWYAGARVASFGDFTFFKDRETASPFAWSVKRDGKIHYFLGTVHVGISLERDVPCSDKILEQITNSDLVFLETRQKSNQLSREEMVTIFTGSREEREDILNRMSPEVRQELIQRAKVTKQMAAIDPYPYRLVYEGNEGF